MRAGTLSAMLAIAALGEAGFMRVAPSASSKPSEPARVKAKPSELKTRTHHALPGSGATESENLKIDLAIARRTRRARKQNPASEAGEKETS